MKRFMKRGYRGRRRSFRGRKGKRFSNKYIISRGGIRF